jgi:cobalt-zinc-cadmium resistance protein CzcA
MIQWLMTLALRERIVVLGAAILLAASGIYAFTQLDIEAYPDPVQPMTEILTLPIGYGAEEVERFVTIPTEYAMSGMLHLQRMESISLYGLSDLRLYFDWDSDYELDRLHTIARLSFVTLPQGITPTLSPENPIGEIYRYTVQGSDHDLVRAKEIEDWVCEKQLKTVPGVLDVSGFGGLTKEYHVEIDPQKLIYYGVPLSQVISAIQNSNTNAGGSYLNVGEQAFDIRGIGLIHSLDDIRNIVLATNKSTPIRISDVGNVSIGWSPRLGIVGMNYQPEVVEGIVLMRKDGNTLKALRGVEKKVHELNTNGMLPRGYKMVPYYDRTGLVYTTLETVLENLALGMILVFAVLLFFLGNLRTALIAAVNVPLAMLGAFILLYLSGTPANLLSLGAVDFGIIIDSTIIVVENIYRHMTAPVPGESPADTGEIIRRAAVEVGGPMFYSTVIFLIAFLPLFTMRGVEGVIFSPMSHTYAYALSIAILLAVILSPVLCATFLPPNMRETHNVVWEAFQRFYHNLFVAIVRWPKLTLLFLLIVVGAGLSVFPSLGGEFLPKLEEGNIWAHAIMPSTINLPTGAKMVDGMRAVFLSFPEVTTVVSQLGRPDDGTETTSFFSIEFSVDLKPASRWPPGMTKERLVREMDTKLRRRFPGVSFSYSQNIEDNIDEALSGVKAGSNVVKVLGDDLDTDESIANRVADILNQVRGIRDVFVFRSLGQPNIVVTPDRAAAARYGLNSGDVAAIVQAAVGGQTVTQVLQGDRSFGLVVRWSPKFRNDLTALRNLRLNAPTGGQVPLGQIATVQAAEGASFIYRGDLQRYVPVRFSVVGRDLEGAVAEAKRRVAHAISVPRGTRLEWVGEYAELQAENHRLAIIIPLTLLLIMGVLYAATLSIVNTMILMAQIPLACFGGVVALAISGTPFSISAAVGFISIFAIAIMDGVLLNFYIHQLWERGYSVIDSIVMGADRRFRAVMMTALVDGLGLLPAALSTRIGAQTQRPLAIVVIGGAISIALLTRVFQPVLVLLLHRYIGLTDEQRPAPIETA